MLEFPLKGEEYIELYALLKVTNLCENGGMAKAQIAQGLVTVDGVVETRKRCKIRSGQLVSYQGHQIKVTDKSPTP